MNLKIQPTTLRITITTDDAADMLMKDQYAGWSREGALALVGYLADLSSDLGEAIDFDVVGLRCDFSEYSSLIDWAQCHFQDYRVELATEIGEDAINDATDDAINEAIREYIAHRGTLIEFDGGCVVSNF